MLFVWTGGWVVVCLCAPLRLFAFDVSVSWQPAVFVTDIRNNFVGNVDVVAF